MQSSSSIPLCVRRSNFCVVGPHVVLSPRPIAQLRSNGVFGTRGNAEEAAFLLNELVTQRITLGSLSISSLQKVLAHLNRDLSERGGARSAVYGPSVTSFTSNIPKQRTR